MSETPMPPNEPVDPTPAPAPSEEPPTARPERPERAAGEIDLAAIQANKRPSDVELDSRSARPVWEEDDAPDGSTASSLMVYERGKPVRVSGPTHYHHLVDGRVVAHYGGGTHYTEPGEDGGPDKITRVSAIHEG